MIRNADMAIFELMRKSHLPQLNALPKNLPFASSILAGGFKYFTFSHLSGEDVQFDYIICFKWVETTNQDF